MTRHNRGVWRGLIWLGLAGLLAIQFYNAWPLQPKQEYGIFLWLIVATVCALTALVLTPRATVHLLRHFDLLLPLVLLLLGFQLLEWLRRLPGLSEILTPSWPVRLVNMSFTLSLHFFLNIALAVGYATWMTAALWHAVREDEGDPFAVLPSALNRFWRILGFETIGWGVMFVGSALLLMLLPFFGPLAFVPMVAFALVWNFMTAALLPAGFNIETHFWKAFGSGVGASLAILKKVWPVLLMQMLILGLLMFIYSDVRTGNSRSTSFSWNIHAFWTGGYEHECRWYDKIVEHFKTSPLPWINTLLALVLGALAIVIKIAIIQRLIPESPITENSMAALEESPRSQSSDLPGV
ncbi:MAG: hypothetical protein AB1813_11060 [Verrucomicrobiota bacterium]